MMDEFFGVLAGKNVGVELEPSLAPRKCGPDPKWSDFQDWMIRTAYGRVSDRLLMSVLDKSCEELRYRAARIEVDKKMNRVKGLLADDWCDLSDSDLRRVARRDFFRKLKETVDES